MPKYEMRPEEKKKLEGQSEHWLITRVFLHPMFRIGVCAFSLLLLAYQLCMTWIVFPWERLPRWIPIFITATTAISVLLACAAGIFGGKLLLRMEKKQKK